MKKLLSLALTVVMIVSAFAVFSVSSQAAEKDLTVGTYSIQNGSKVKYDFGLIADDIKEAKLDVVGFQSFDQNTTRNKNQDTLKILSEKTGLKYSAFVQTVGEEATPDKGFGNAILSKYPIVKTDSYLVSNFGYGSEKRIVLIADINFNGTIIKVMSVQFTWDGKYETQKKQLHAVAEEMKKMAAKGDKMILCINANAPVENEFKSEFKGYVMANAQDTIYKSCPNYGSECFDNVISNIGTAKARGMLDTFAKKHSDHNIVWMKLSIPVNDPTPAKTWDYTLVDGVLTVKGTGAVVGKQASDYPWDAKRNEIKKIVVEDGITAVGPHCFTHCPNLTEFVSGKGLQSLDTDSISYAEKLATVKFGAPITSMGQGVFYKDGAIKNVTLTNQTKEEFTKVATVKPYNMKASGGIATGLDTATFKTETVQIDGPKAITIEAYNGGNLGGFENWGNPKETNLLVIVKGDQTNYNKDCTWKISFNDGTKVQTVNLKVTSEAVASGSPLYRFQPCVEEEENRFVPVVDKEYKVKVEISKGGEVIAKSAEVGGFKCNAANAPIVPTPPTPPTPPVTGDATVYVAVLAVVALFGTAVVFGKKILN